MNCRFMSPCRFTSTSTSYSSPAKVEPAAAAAAPDQQQAVSETTVTSAPRTAAALEANGLLPPGHEQQGAPPAEAAAAAASELEPGRTLHGNGFHSRTASLFGEDFSVADLSAPPTPAFSAQGFHGLQAAAAQQPPQQPSAAGDQTARAANPAGHPTGSARNSFSFPDLAAPSQVQQSAPAATVERDAPPEPDSEKVAVGVQPWDGKSSGSNGKHLRRKSRSQLDLPPWQA